MNNYLLFHAIAEIFSVLIAWGIFAVAWNSRRYVNHSFFLFVGIAYAGVGSVDLLHTLSYSGMGVFPAATANLPTQLWIAARYMSAVGLLLGPLFLSRKVRTVSMALPWFLATAVLLLFIFTGWFPDCYRPDAGGLTPFKIASEYLICALIVVAMALLWQRRASLDETVLKLLLASMALTVLTELAFTLYTDVYGAVNILGHIIKIAADALLYRAIVVTGLQRPYQTLFRDLQQLNDQLESRVRTQTAEIRAANERLEQRVAERTAALQTANQALQESQQAALKIMQEAVEARRETERTSEQLRLSERQYRRLFNNMSEGFAVHEIVTDGDGEPVDYIFLDVNPAFETLTGLKRDDLVDRRVLEVLPDTESQWIQTYGRVALTGEPAHLEAFSQEMARWYEAFAYQPAPGQFAVVFADISQRKRDEEALRRLNETLESRVAERTREVQDQADRLRALASELTNAETRERKRLGRILHDHIQQLMVAARMQLSWLTTTDDPEERDQSVKSIDSILYEALQASRDLMADLSPPALQESGLVGGLKWLSSRMAKNNRFTVRLHAQDHIEPDTEETRFLLFQCVRELLFNVVKHAGVSQADVIMSRCDERHLQLAVVDEGNGFDPDEISREPADTVSFGLFSIAERLAHIGGHMEITSAPGQGSRFTLTVPMNTASADPQAEETADDDHHPADGDTSKHQHCRVLIVDDHEIVRKGLVRLLQAEPDMIVIGEATGAQEAVTLAHRLRPDVVIMDVHLGNTSGIEATRRIRSRHPEIAVVMLSMLVDSDVSSAMHEAGAAACLGKDGPSATLIEAVRECCARCAIPTDSEHREVSLDRSGESAAAGASDSVSCPPAEHGPRLPGPPG